MHRILLILLIVMNYSCSKEIYRHDGFEYSLYENSAKEGIQALKITNKDFYDYFITNINQFSDLYFLDISNLGIHTLSGKICLLKKLRVIKLDYNEGIELPECIYSDLELYGITMFMCRSRVDLNKMIEIKGLRELGIGGNTFDEQELKEVEQEYPKIRIVTSVD